MNSSIIDADPNYKSNSLLYVEDIRNNLSNDPFNNFRDDQKDHVFSDAPITEREYDINISGSMDYSPVAKAADNIVIPNDHPENRA